VIAAAAIGFAEGFATMTKKQRECLTAPVYGSVRMSEATAGRKRAAISARAFLLTCG